MGQQGLTEGTNYDDNTEPDVSDGLGTIYVPLGKLTIDDGVASFSALTCGDITLTQCAGILGHTRG